MTNDRKADLEQADAYKRRADQARSLAEGQSLSALADHLRGAAERPRRAVLALPVLRN